MAAAVDFQSVMAELSQFQNALGDIHASLKNQKNKEILGDVLDRIREARADVEVEYPKVMDLILSTARQCQDEAQQNLAKIADKKAQIQQKTAALAAAQKALPAKPELPDAKIDPVLGQKLRLDLLERFCPDETDLDGMDRIREAWEDWE